MARRRHIKPCAPCCRTTPASRCRTRPSRVIAARCWMRPGQRKLAIQGQARPNHRHPPKPNCQRVRPSAIHDLAGRASLTPKIFSAAAQKSPVAATKSDYEAKSCPRSKREFGYNIRDQRALPCGLTRARRGRQLWCNEHGTRFRRRHGGVVALRLRSSRLSAAASLFRPPNHRPKRDYGDSATGQNN